MNPEFSRPVRIDMIGEGSHSITVEAEPAERAALAQRFGLISLAALAAEAELHREGDVVIATGRIRATVEQACVASGAAVPAMIDEPFALRFVPATVGGETEIDVEDCDVIDYEGGAVDLGEAVAETLALSLDPFPRAADADAILKEAGVLSEDDVVTGPFAALKALQDKIQK